MASLPGLRDRATYVLNGVRWPVGRRTDVDDVMLDGLSLRMILGECVSGRDG